jgi:hypothetical protein
VQARRTAGKAESGIRTHMLTFRGAWNRVNNKVYNVPELETPKIASRSTQRSTSRLNRSSS